MYYAQTLLTGLAMLLLVFLHHIRQSREEVNHQIFTALLLANAGLLLFELLLNLAQYSIPSQALLTGIVVVFYILNPVPSALWVLFVVNHLKKQPSFRPLFLFGVFLPFIVNGIVTVASIWGGYNFTISPENIYSRGPWFGILVLSGYWNQFVAFYIVFAHRKDIPRKELFALQFFAIPPILAGIIQVAFFGVSILWLAMAFSVLIVYMDIQGAQSFTDHLTGLGNRRRFDRHLQYIFTNYRRKRGLGAILIDLNDFKKANDTYGHHIGDRALEAIGVILERSVRHDDLIARLGGDEFGILMSTESAEVVENVIQRIEHNLQEFNQRAQLPFTLSLSLGWLILNRQVHSNALDFLREVDQKMYQDKLARKQNLT